MNSSYINAVRTQRTALQAQYPEGFVLVMSIENLSKASAAGNMCEVTTASAAQLLVNATHRLASEVEASEFRRSQALARAQSTPIDGLQAARAHFDAIMSEKDARK